MSKKKNGCFRFVATNRKAAAFQGKVQQRSFFLGENLSYTKSNNNDGISIKATIDRMIDDVSIALDDYDNHKISFEISGEQYNKLKKWKNSVDDRLFRYQLETGELGPGSNTRLFESLLDLLKLTSKQEGKAKPYYGTCGGGYLYKFLPTTIGLITKVENVATKEEVDLTDYESL
jgi:hypothetical protein